MRSIFTIPRIKTTQRDGMINAENLIGMEEFDYIRIDDAGSFINIWNDTSEAVATKVGIPTQSKLQGFLYWYHDNKKRGMIPVEANFDTTAMRLVVENFDTEKVGKELDLTDLDPGKIYIYLKW